MPDPAHLTHVVRVCWPDGRTTALELHRDSASGLVFGVEDGFASQGEEGVHPTLFSPYSGQPQAYEPQVAVEPAPRMRSV